jgi:hypothetical protein
MLPQMQLFSPVVQKFVIAAEYLMINDVIPQSLMEIDLKAIRYYAQCLSDKFASPPTSSDGASSNGLQAQVSA